jgi:FkbM family methyltransferase
MFVVQIGGADGKTDSHRDVDEVWELVTEKGWRAVILEPSPRHFKQLKQTYKKEEKVSLLEFAVAEHHGTTTFYDCELFGASTLIEKVLEKNHYHDGKSKNYKPITVECTHINTLLTQFGTPDYLVIDAEGYDGYIIEMLDLKQFQIPKIRFEFAHIEHGPEQQAQLGRVCLKLIKAGYKLEHDKADIVAKL